MNTDFNTMKKAVKNMCEDVCELLRLTNDGNKLAPKHLSLVQLVVNGEASGYGLQEFYKILGQAREGKYDAGKVWAYNIENMTKDQVGYIYWRGSHIEHYSHRNYREEKTDALQLAERCKLIESKGLEVCGETVWAHCNKYLTPEEIAECEIVLEIDNAELISMKEFIKINTAPDVQPIGDSDIEIIKGLQVGQTAILGGGAVAIMNVHRVA